MIAINYGFFMMLTPEGEQVAFDPENLRAELLEAFFLSGAAREAWLTDEICAGIEFALSNVPAEKRTRFTTRDLTEIVTRILEQTGYQKVANTYVQLQFPGETDLPGSLPSIFAILAERFEQWPPNAIGECAEKIFHFITANGLRDPSRNLICELAINLANHETTDKKKIPIPTQISGAKPQLLLEAEKAVKLMPSACRRLFESKVLDVYPIGSLFSNIHIRLHWMAFCAYYGIAPGATEFEIVPHLNALSVQINTLSNRIKEKLERTEALPMSIEALESGAFVTQILGAPSFDSGRRLAESLLHELSLMLTTEPYQLLLF